MLQKLEIKSSHESRTKTGEFKYSKLFRRTVHEYNHGIICRCCGNSATITSFSAKTPKYCGQACRNVVKRKQALNSYYQKSRTPF